MVEPAAENAPAPAWPERDESAWAELSARIERLRQKPSVEFLGKTLTGASSGIAASTPQPEEAGRTVEGGGSEEAEKFLRMATRALEGETRARELNDAVSEAIAAKDRLSGLDEAEERVETARSKFKTQLDETLRDPSAFLGWFDQLFDPQKREMLRLLEFERTAFAREFSAALESGAAQATNRQFVVSSNPEKRVFVNPVGDGDLRLAAHDGEWYLEKVRACRAAFREAREVFRLPKSATRVEVRKAASDHVGVAKGREADAVFQKQRLGKTAELYEVRGALRRLSVSDQEWVVKQLPALAKHIKHVAQAGIDLAEGPRRKASGYDF